MFDLVSNKFKTNFIDLTQSQKTSVIRELLVMENSIRTEYFKLCVNKLFKIGYSRENVKILIRFAELNRKVQQYVKFAMTNR